MTRPTIPPGLKQEDFKLSSPEIRQSFELRIRPDLEGPEMVQPVWVIVTGQMAAGKSTAMTLVARRFGLTRPGWRDGDHDVRAHPDYRWLRDQYGAAVARELTEHITDPIGELADRFLISNRRDAIISGPYDNPDDVRAIFPRLTELGIRLEVVCLATHESESLLANNDRFHQIEQVHPGHGEFVSPYFHDGQYRGVRETIQVIEQERLTDGMHIMLQRGGQFVYSNELTNHRREWRHPPQAALKLDQARNRPWTDGEHREFHRRALVALQRESDPHRRTSVVDAIIRSHKPNDTAITRLTVQAQALQDRVADHTGPTVNALKPDSSDRVQRRAQATDQAAVDAGFARIEQRSRYSEDLTSAAQEWAAEAPPWFERPYGAVSDEALAKMPDDARVNRHAAIAQAEDIQSRAREILAAAQAREGSEAMQVAERFDATVPGMQTQIGGEQLSERTMFELARDFGPLIDRALRTDMAAAEHVASKAARQYEELSKQVDMYESIANEARAELVIRACLPDDRAAAEAVQRRSYLRQQVRLRQRAGSGLNQRTEQAQPGERRPMPGQRSEHRRNNRSRQQSGRDHPHRHR